MKGKVEGRGRSDALAVSDDATKRKNEHHASDFRYAVQISVYLLKPIGAWPLADNETSIPRVLLHKASMAIATFLLIFTIVPWIAQIIKENWSVLLILRTMCPLFFTMTIFARYVLLLWHQDRLRSCIDRVADDWRCTTIDRDREIMLENARLGRAFGIVSVAFMFSCGILFYSLPLLSLNLSNEDNVTVRLHPSPCEFLVFDAKVKFPIFAKYIIYIYIKYIYLFYI